MFDWNDEEFANIIWGNASESDDHIVPFHDGAEEKPPGSYGYQIKKEWNQEASDVKAAMQKKSVPKTEFDGSKLGSITQGVLTSGLSMDSWPDLSLSNVAETDHDSMDTEAFNNLTESSKYKSSEDDTARVVDGSEIFQNRRRNTEESDFVDYGWANIGNFDDFDRIFSNTGLIFGDVSLDNTVELWSSSKDVASSPLNSIAMSLDSPSLGLEALKTTPDHFEIKTEYVLDQDKSLNYEKICDPTSHVPQNVLASVDHKKYAGGKSRPSVKNKTTLEMVGKAPAFNSPLDSETVATPNVIPDKVNSRKNLLKVRKKSEVSEARQLQDLCGTWSQSGNEFQQFDVLYAMPVGQPCPSLVLGQQKQLQGPESSGYKHLSNPLLVPSVYGSTVNQYPVVPVLPQFHSSEGNHQPAASGYEFPPGNLNPSNKPPDAPLKPLMMTPLEKIEKLRRRQQMRAMVAIQKQRQQFSHQISCSKAEGIPSTLPCIDPNSPIEQDDSGTVSMAFDEHSAEDPILFQLQDIIEKLDIRVRLAIRDSLFRLAQSAIQRHYDSDTSSTNKPRRDELDVSKKEEINSNNRFARMLNLETQTNPIDRTVAHLLFHRPLDLSGKLLETNESPLSAKLPCARKATGSMNLSMGLLPENSETKQTLYHHGSTIPCLFPEGNQSNCSSFVDASENASNNEAADGGAREVEFSL